MCGVYISAGLLEPRVESSRTCGHCKHCAPVAFSSASQSAGALFGASLWTVGELVRKRTSHVLCNICIEPRSSHLLVSMTVLLFERTRGDQQQPGILRLPSLLSDRQHRRCFVSISFCFSAVYCLQVIYTHH